jgi:hypothetical protein
VGGWSVSCRCLVSVAAVHDKSRKHTHTHTHTGVGCLISGLLHVQRAPGMLKIQAVSDSHEFNWETMDVSHTINHLSFGPFLSETAWAVNPNPSTRNP